MENNVFKTLNAINVNDMVEKKETGKATLTYLSWANAWKVAKEQFPDLSYEIERDPQTNLPYWYDERTGYMVFTKVTIEGQTHEMWLPVMDGSNRAMKAEAYEVQTKYKKITVAAATMTDINKAIMRCLVKNLAMFGLGLYVYAGEDLPDTSATETVQAQAPAPTPAPAPKPKEPVKDISKITAEQLSFVKAALQKSGIDEGFVATTYKVTGLEELKVYQAQHIIKNISKLKEMYKAQQPKQEESFDLEKLGISEKELEEMGEAFSA